MCTTELPDHVKNGVDSNKVLLKQFVSVNMEQAYKHFFFNSQTCKVRFPDGKKPPLCLNSLIQPKQREKAVFVRGESQPVTSV